MHPFTSVPLTVYCIVTVGVINRVAEELPVFQVKLEAPEGIRPAVSPMHNNWEEELTEIAGNALTVMGISRLSRQPPIVPFTLKILLAVGVITIDDPGAPVFQVYEPAPVTLKVEVLPIHTAVLPATDKSARLRTLTVDTAGN
jgi:hypothetical protein